MPSSQSPSGREIWAQLATLSAETAFAWLMMTVIWALTVPPPDLAQLVAAAAAVSFVLLSRRLAHSFVSARAELAVVALALHGLSEPVIVMQDHAIVRGL